MCQFFVFPNKHDFESISESSEVFKLFTVARDKDNVHKNLSDALFEERIWESCYSSQLQKHFNFEGHVMAISSVGKIGSLLEQNNLG